MLRDYRRNWRSGSSIHSLVFDLVWYRSIAGKFVCKGHDCKIVGLIIENRMKKNDNVRRGFWKNIGIWISFLICYLVSLRKDL